MIRSVMQNTIQKADREDIFFELTRSMCPECRRIIDAQIRLRNNQVIMRKRCPEHGWFEALVYNDAKLYTDSLPFNKPGTIPLPSRPTSKTAAHMTAGCARSTSSTPAWALLK